MAHHLWIYLNTTTLFYEPSFCVCDKSDITCSPRCLIIFKITRITKLKAKTT